MAEHMRFDGRVAIVTGGGQGLGQAYANLLASRGAALVVNDLPDEGTAAGTSSRAAKAAEQIVAAGGKAIAIGGDVTSEEAMDSLIRQTIEQFGRIDVLIANAGTAWYVPFHEMSLVDFDRMIRIHVHGSFLPIRAAWPHMMQRGYGRIVMTSSSGMFGMEKSAHYAAGKGGVAGFMKALSLDGRALGINVNAIMPLAATPLARQVTASATIGADSATTTAAVAELGGAAELVAPVVAWLAHEDCRISGELIQAGMGVAGRVVAAHGPGYVNPAMTLESVRDHWAEISRSDAAGEFPDLTSAMHYLIEARKR